MTDYIRISQCTMMRGLVIGWPNIMEGIMESDLRQMNKPLL